MAEWLALIAALAVFAYVGWDGALWDARFQLLLHLLAVGAAAGIAAIALRGGAVPRTPLDLPILALLAAFGVATLSAANLGMSLRAMAAIAAFAVMLCVALVAVRHRPSWVGVVTAVPVLLHLDPDPRRHSRPPRAVDRGGCARTAAAPPAGRGHAFRLDRGAAVRHLAGVRARRTDRVTTLAAGGAGRPGAGGHPAHRAVRLALGMAGHGGRGGGGGRAVGLATAPPPAAGRPAGCTSAIDRGRRTRGPRRPDRCRRRHG